MKTLKEKLIYFVDSVRYAVRGLVYAWETEQNFRTEVVIAIIVLFFTFLFPLRPIEQLLVGLLIVWVLSLELINTVLERTMDVVNPKTHHYVKSVKDLMAGAVLISAAGALVIGTIIFYPYIQNFILYYFF